MSHLLTILRAAHCRSTHHFFAIDALPKVQTQEGKRLADILLKYHDEYLLGAKAPDKTFRDFQNHVLHVSDGNWGGAPKKCVEWYQLTVQQLESGKFSDAAYSCGVLSHYFTDPIMPLHTGQSDQEATLHRPMEWSICKSYQSIRKLPVTQSIALPMVGHGADGLKQFVIDCATIAHAHYYDVMAGYDLTLGCKLPTKGLDVDAQETFAQLFNTSIDGLALLIDRLAAEVESELPTVNLTLSTLLATLDMPWAWILKKVDDVKEKASIRAILAEYEATGQVKENLAEESVVVRRHRQAEREQRKQVTIGGAQTAGSTSSPATITVENRPRLDSFYALEESREGVHYGSELVDAPSIGPKTAKRFEKIGIRTIREFVDADVADMARKLETRWINEQLLEDWQCQAQLVCDLPVLCGYKSQLLVAAGYRTSELVGSADAVGLYREIVDVCESSEGRRILRSSRAPDLAEVEKWVQCGRQFAARRAA